LFDFVPFRVNQQKKNTSEKTHAQTHYMEATKQASDVTKNTFSKKTSERQTKFRCFLALSLNDISHFWGNIITYRLLGRYKGYEPNADRSANKQKQPAKQLSIRHVTLQDGNLNLYIRFENNRKNLPR